MSTALYWALFALTALILLIGVPFVDWLERHRDGRGRRDLDRRARRERTEHARRRIRLGL